MPQKEYVPETDAHLLQVEAWAAFDRWCQEFDPEGNMETLDLVNAYAAAMAVSNGHHQSEAK